MTWTEADEAKKVYKFMKAGVLAPEDLKPNEFRLLKTYYPGTAQFVRNFLELREEKIRAGEWSEECEPPKTDRRIKRYENGNGIVDPYDP